MSSIPAAPPAPRELGGPGRPQLLSALILARNYAALILFAVLFVVLSIASPAFLTSQNLLNILSQQAPVAIIACAMTLVIIAGSFDLSTGAIVAVANVLAAKVAVDTGSVWLGMLCAPAVGLGLGVVNGLIITLFRIHSFLATLATSLVYSGLALLITNGALIPVSLPGFTWLGQGALGEVANASLLLIAFAICAMVLLNRTVTGRHVFAVGGNPEAALLSGIRVNLIHVVTFAFSGLASGLAAAILVSRVQSGQPTQGASFTLTAIAAVILGGTSIYGGAGAVWRSLIGVYLLALIGNGFNLLGANPFYESLVTGVVIVSAVALAAAGRRR
ncbi:MAG TPA: ABC transporter permease [Solirubrobacterales bacterium]|nr:ABC transporter permease [Solirubrobacterales bacterium]